MADVIAKIVADVITTILNVLADGIAKWQMEIATCRVEDGKWLMLLPLGRCYSPGSMFILIKFWDVIQNLIPYMWQMVFTNISI